MRTVSINLHYEDREAGTNMSVGREVVLGNPAFDEEEIALALEKAAEALMKGGPGVDA